MPPLFWNLKKIEDLRENIDFPRMFRINEKTEKDLFDKYTIDWVLGRAEVKNIEAYFPFRLNTTKLPRERESVIKAVAQNFTDYALSKGRQLKVPQNILDNLDQYLASEDPNRSGLFLKDEFGEWYFHVCIIVAQGLDGVGIKWYLDKVSNDYFFEGYRGYLKDYLSKFDLLKEEFETVNVIKSSFYKGSDKR